MREVNTKDLVNFDYKKYKQELDLKNERINMKSNLMPTSDELKQSNLNAMAYQLICEEEIQGANLDHKTDSKLRTTNRYGW